MIKKQPIYFDFSLTTTDSLSVPIPGNRKVEIKKDLLDCITANLILAEKLGADVIYSRRKDFYSNQPKYKYNFQTYKLMIQLIDLLEKEGVLNNTLGEWDMKTNYKSGSIISPLKDIKGKFFYRKPAQEIILREITREKVLNESTGREHIEKKKELKDYEETDETQRMRSLVQRWNDLRFKTNIEIDTQSLDISDWLHLLEPISDTKSKVIPKGAYRVFVNDFNKYGRFSGATETLIKREFRKHLIINGSPTIELDFKALHINMLYHREGIDYQSDPYTDASSPKHDRSVFKKIALISLNASSKSSAIKSLVIELPSYTYQELQDLLDHWLEVHKPIAKYLCSGIGLNLMYQDSQIAEYVINHFTEKNIMVLCIHDSFIIAGEHEEELKEVMEIAYRKIVFNYEIKIEKK